LGRRAAGHRQGTLQAYVSRLRAALDDGRLDGGSAGYRLRIDRGELDAE
jgi:hypothetical protein